MGTESTPKATVKVVKIGKALELAEAWVKNMSGSATTGSDDLEVEGRPPRLGLGAKVTPNAKAVTSTDPVERKLLGKLNASKRKSSKDSPKTQAEDSAASREDDDEPESRTGAIVKKRALPSVTTPQSKKKK